MKSRNEIERMLRSCSPHELAALLSGETMWTTRANIRAGIPSLTMSDGPHGLRCQLHVAGGDNLGIGTAAESTCFPSGSTLAMSWDEALFDEIGEAMGRQAAALGVGMVLGPAVNIQRDPRGGRTFEYLSEDPEVSGRLGAAMVRGIQRTGRAACPKHFAVNSQELRRQASNSVVDERTLREIYLTAFEIIVREAEPMAIMTSYNMINGTYAHENSRLLTWVLRDEWGFDGMVVSDWGGSNSAVAAVKAGGSLEMPSPGMVSVRELKEAFKAGEITGDELLERAVDVARVALSVAESDAAGACEAGMESLLESGHDLAVRAAERSMTLLKNDGALPLASGTRVALLGGMASQLRFQGGGSSEVTTGHAETDLASALRDAGLDVVAQEEGYVAGSAESDARKIARDAARAAGSDADVVVAVVGLDDRSESEGADRADLQLPQAQNDMMREAVRWCKEARKPLVVVLLGGSPVELPWLKDVDALLLAGLPGEGAAPAIARTLAGMVNPAGHVAQTWPLAASDMPTAGRFPVASRDSYYLEGPFVGYRYYTTTGQPVAFPFGFGLSYSAFELGDLEISDGEARCTVRNVSERDGETVVQMYVEAPSDGGARPLRELKGFVRVAVPAGESRTVRLPFNDRTFRHFDVASNRWRTTSGAWTVGVGFDCENLPLTGLVHVHGDMAPQPADPALGAYIYGDVHQASRAEQQTLFGIKAHGIAPDDVPLGAGDLDGSVREMDVNDPLRDWAERSPGRAGRWVGRTLMRRVERHEAPDGSVDFATRFVLDMPPRAMAKLTGGRIDGAMAQAIAQFGSGHPVRATVALVRNTPKNLVQNAVENAKLHRKI